MSEIFSAFLLGAICGAIPAAILTATFVETLRGGFRAGARVVFFAFLCETAVAATILFLFFWREIPEIFIKIISIFGAAILLDLARKIWKIKKIENRGRAFLSAKKIFALTFFNGTLWTFWITVCIPSAAILREKFSGGHFLFLLFFEIGWFLVTIFLVFLFAKSRKILTNEKIVGQIFKILAGFLLFLAGKMFFFATKFFAKFFNF